MKILHIDSSIMGDKSVSRHLSAQLVQHITSIQPNSEVAYRDLASQPVDHLSPAHILGEADSADVADAKALLQQFLESNVVVIGAPMHNLTITSQLKTWLDRILVAGVTFRYTEKGPVGLLTEQNKKVFIISSRGGFHPTDLSDHQEGMLNQLFNFIGVTDVTIIRAEAVDIDPTHREKAINQASLAISSVKI